MWLTVQAVRNGLHCHSECVHAADLDTAVAAAERKLIVGQMSTLAEWVLDVAGHAGKAAALLKPARQTVCLQSDIVTHQ